MIRGFGIRGKSCENNIEFLDQCRIRPLLPNNGNRMLAAKFSESQGEIFSYFNVVLDYSLSLADNEYPYGASLSKVVQLEAIKTCQSGTWVGLMSILALSSIINKNINVFYPDCGNLKYKLLFGSQVHPRISSNICDEVNLFYVMHGSKLKAGDNFQPHHFVPCLFLPNHKLKRKWYILVVL